MKLLPKSLIIAYIFLSSIASFGFIFLNRVTFKSLIKSKFTSNSVDIELSKENDKQWAKEISNGGKPEFGVMKSRNHENPVLIPSISRAKKILGWKPKIKLKRGLKITKKNFYE